MPLIGPALNTGFKNQFESASRVAAVEDKLGLFFAGVNQRARGHAHEIVQRHAQINFDEHVGRLPAHGFTFSNTT